MAQTALARNCPNCGTLVTCAGKYSDEELTGHCPCCKAYVTMGNANFVPSIDAERDALRAQNEALRQENAALVAQRDELQAALEQYEATPPNDTVDETVTGAEAATPSDSEQSSEDAGDAEESSDGAA